MRPSFITARWSDMESASSWSWVTSRKVTPARRCRALSSTRICWRNLGSSAARGSSSSRTSGWRTSERALAVFIDIAPGISGENRRQAVFEAAGVSELWWNDNFPRGIDVSNLTVAADGEDGRVAGTRDDDNDYHGDQE